MKKIIIIPDSFKGTMTSPEVCEIIKTELSKQFNPKDIITIPIADGGEGTVNCFTHFTEATRFSAKVKGPSMNDITASYAIFDNTAIIEIASVVGYSLAPNVTTPMDTTTYGVGQLIKDALDRGCKKIILGLGGSCTNDAGTGLAAALGTKFTDTGGNTFLPVGKNLGNVKHIDISETKKLLHNIEIIGMCDITNPLYGQRGAAFMFAPQKGASPEEVKILDDQLISLSQTIQDCLGLDVSNLKGSGAAGGMGAGIHAFLGGTLISGIDLILELAGFDRLLTECSVIITGEGRLDQQSLGGKAISGISRHAREKNVPIIVVTGEQEPGLENLKALGIQTVFETGKIDRTQPVSEIQRTCRRALRTQAGVLANHLKNTL